MTIKAKKKTRLGRREKPPVHTSVERCAGCRRVIQDGYCPVCDTARENLEDLDFDLDPNALDRDTYA